MEAAVEQFLDFRSFEGDSLELSFVVVVEERQSFSSIWRKSAGINSTGRILSSLLVVLRGLTVHDDSHQRLLVLVKDLPEGKRFLWRVRQKSEEQRDGVV